MCDIHDQIFFQEGRDGSHHPSIPCCVRCLAEECMNSEGIHGAPKEIVVQEISAVLLDVLLAAQHQEARISWTPNLTQFFGEFCPKVVAMLVHSDTLIAPLWFELARLCLQVIRTICPESEQVSVIRPLWVALVNSLSPSSDGKKDVALESLNHFHSDLFVGGLALDSDFARMTSATVFLYLESEDAKERGLAWRFVENILRLSSDDVLEQICNFALDGVPIANTAGEPVVAMEVFLLELFWSMIPFVIDTVRLSSANVRLLCKMIVDPIRDKGPLFNEIVLKGSSLVVSLDCDSLALVLLCLMQVHGGEDVVTSLVAHTEVSWILASTFANLRHGEQHLLVQRSLEMLFGNEQMLSRLTDPKACNRIMLSLASPLGSSLSMLSLKLLSHLTKCKGHLVSKSILTQLASKLEELPEDLDLNVIQLMALIFRQSQSIEIVRSAQVVLGKSSSNREILSEIARSKMELGGLVLAASLPVDDLVQFTEFYISHVLANTQSESPYLYTEDLLVQIEAILQRMLQGIPAVESGRLGRMLIRSGVPSTLLGMRENLAFDSTIHDLAERLKSISSALMRICNFGSLSFHLAPSSHQNGNAIFDLFYFFVTVSQPHAYQDRARIARLVDGLVRREQEIMSLICDKARAEDVTVLLLFCLGRMNDLDVGHRHIIHSLGQMFELIQASSITFELNWTNVITCLDVLDEDNVNVEACTNGDHDKGGNLLARVFVNLYESGALGKAIAKAILISVTWQSGLVRSVLGIQKTGVSAQEQLRVLKAIQGTTDREMYEAVVFVNKEIVRSFDETDKPYTSMDATVMPDLAFLTLIAWMSQQDGDEEITFETSGYLTRGLHAITSAWLSATREPTQNQLLLLPSTPMLESTTRFLASVAVTRSINDDLNEGLSLDEIAHPLMLRINLISLMALSKPRQPRGHVVAEKDSTSPNNWNEPSRWIGDAFRVFARIVRQVGQAFNPTSPRFLELATYLATGLSSNWFSHEPALEIEILAVICEAFCKLPSCTCPPLKAILAQAISWNVSLFVRRSPQTKLNACLLQRVMISAYSWHVSSVSLRSQVCPLDKISTLNGFDVLISILEATADARRDRLCGLGQSIFIDRSIVASCRFEATGLKEIFIPIATRLIHLTPKQGGDRLPIPTKWLRILTRFCVEEEWNGTYNVLRLAIIAPLAFKLFGSNCYVKNDAFDRAKLSFRSKLRDTFLPEFLARNHVTMQVAAKESNRSKQRPERKAAGKRLVEDAATSDSIGDRKSMWARMRQAISPRLANENTWMLTPHLIRFIYMLFQELDQAEQELSEGLAGRLSESVAIEWNEYLALVSTLG